MQARSALFDLFGDHLRTRGGRAPVAALVRLLGPIDIEPAAVRTAISRMVRQGWLLPVRVGGGPGYQLSVRAVHRLDEAAGRIYRTPRPPWDGRFDLLVLTLPRPARPGSPRRDRAERTRIASTLAYLGYGRIDASTWVSPRPCDEVDTLLKEAGLPFERFTAMHAAGSTGATALVRRAWDLATLGTAYDGFVASQTIAVSAVTDHSTDEAAYGARFRLVHEWRTFLFRDPQLPVALLPESWPGVAAAQFFDHHESRLRPATDRFVDACLAAV
jgi:phenylacetic acid degradation operon negative regulatory protein